MSGKSDAQYTPLSVEDDGYIPDVHHPSRPPTQKWTIVFCIAAVVLNLGLVGFSVHVDRELAVNILPDVASLPTPDAYVGLPTPQTPVQVASGKSAA
ncbi:hypothetical protein B0H11DRAFT_2289734 [Mycena galericulata]|nr:hypothetical protein B0H11DRAFT_2289734 [Mycena galericulata]